MSVEGQAQAVADYYEGYPPPPPEGATPEQQATYAQQQAAWAGKFGPGGPPAPPDPPAIPGPASPGAGMPAARIGDLCAHGGSIVGPGDPNVLIGYMVAVRAMPAMDQVACPMFNGPVPHATGTILKGSNTVLIGYMPAARVADPIGPPSVCAGNAIAMGCTNVLIGDLGGTGSGTGAAGAASGPAAADETATGTATSGDEATTTYADTAPTSQPPGESQQSAGTGTHWIELELVDDAEQPVAGEAYLVILPEGQKVSGGLDERGQVHIKGIKQPGWCRISFPNLDLAAWQRWRPAPPTPPPSAGPTAPPPAHAAPAAATGRDQDQSGSASPSRHADSPSQSGGPVPQGASRSCGEWREVLQGECISSIARDTGHFWETIWNHAANAALKARRGEPNVLLAGDAVLVPHKRPKEDSGSTDQHHKFRRRGEPAQLRMRLLDDGIPRANLPFQLDVDGRRFEGVTDADGILLCPIPGNARRGHLVVGPPDDPTEYDLQLGFLDPCAELSGAQMRLSNLSLYGGAAHGKLDEETREAIAAFQGRAGLAVTGEPDAGTLQKLQDVHDTPGGTLHGR
ncbi:MAG: PAAR domain-containing protein [Planctomycetes bacterium]|nr:PAAR domain-containing protein [Planctomycetota bacterium]